MKFENNNKEVITRITKRSLKTNGTRNIFTIMAIVLTTFMISSVFSIGISFAKNFKTMNLRMQGTTATTALKSPSKEQVSKLKELNIFKSMGYQIDAGMVILEDTEKTGAKIKLEYHDDMDWEKQIKQCISDIKGEYPTKDNQVMISRKALEFLDIKNPNIGQKIKVSWKIGEEVKELEFILSGYFTNYDFVQDTGYLMVSKEFIEKNGLSLENNGTVFMTIKSNEKAGAPDLLEKEIPLKEGQEFNYNYDTEDEVSSGVLASMATVGIISLFIVLSGYLLIYNVMYIAVTKDINFYGLLKTIGTSPRQIKKIVMGQALRLSIIGIPIGLIIGLLVSFGVVPLAMDTFSSGTYGSAMPSNISFNPLIFIGAALFSLLTVVLSCRKPAKLASNISPTEALRYSGAKSKGNKKNRNSTKGGKLYKMAWYNVFRDKKRAIVVFLSLFMGIMTFLSVNTFLNSISVDNFIGKYVKSDFKIRNVHLQKENMDNELINKIKAMEGVKEVIITKGKNVELDMTDNFFLPIITDSYKERNIPEDQLNLFLQAIKEDPSVYSGWILGVDDSLIEKYNEEAEKKINLEKFKAGEFALVVPSFYSSKKDETKFDDLEGEIFKLKDKDSKVTQSYKAKFFYDEEDIFPYGLGGVVGAPTFYISNSMMEKLDKDIPNYLLEINVDEKYEGKIKNELSKIANGRGLMFEAKSDKTEDFNSTSMVMNILGGGVSVILILIGILNFINVMITGVNTRLRELAVMESIGMTKKQIKKMITLEGFYYSGITTLFICTIGVAVIYGISQLSKQIADYAEFVFPIIPIVVLIGFIAIVCLITPVIVFKMSSKKSVTERIREIEN